VAADPRGAATDTTAPPPSSDPRGEVGGGESDAPADPRGASAGNEEKEDIIVRAREYIAKQKEKFVDDIKLKLGKDMLAYNSIQAHNASVTAPINGSSGEHALEGMVGMGKRRLLASSLKFDLKSI
jgi:hypothetical protein